MAYSDVSVMQVSSLMQPLLQEGEREAGKTAFATGNADYFSSPIIVNLHCSVVCHSNVVIVIFSCRFV